MSAATTGCDATTPATAAAAKAMNLLLTLVS
jgi:hypothetical protein